MAVRPHAAAHFRAHARRRSRIRAKVTRVASGQPRDASVMDLGMGGARILVDGSLSAGEEVAISFLAPSLWDPLALLARVAWVKPGERDGQTLAGLAFEPRDVMGVFALFELVSTLR